MRTRAQQLMIDDGFPPELFVDDKQREQAWAGRQFTMPVFAAPQTASPELIAFAEGEAERKQLRDKARITKMLQHKSTPDPSTHRWDTMHNRWVPLRIYKQEDNMRPDFYTMSNTELIQTFNEMAVEAASLQLPVGVVKRFATREAGLRRCEELYKTICEKKNLDYENPPRRSEEERAAEPSSKAAKAKPAKKTKTAKPAKSVAKKLPKKVKKEGLAISDACGVRSGTKQEIILLYLEERLGKQVPQTAILKHLYGDPDAKTLRFLALTRTMKKARGYVLKQEKDEKGNVSYGLYKKNGN